MLSAMPYDYYAAAFHAGRAVCCCAPLSAAVFRHAGATPYVTRLRAADMLIALLRFAPCLIRHVSLPLMSSIERALI